MRFLLGWRPVLLAVAVAAGLALALTVVPGGPLQHLVYRAAPAKEVALVRPTPEGTTGREAAAPSPAATEAPAAAPSPTPTPQTLRIVTVLPKDAIPAILDPRFVSAEAAAEQMEPDERVLGLSINGEHRAYSIPTLSGHEVVNDTVGGVPVAVTW